MFQYKVLLTSCTWNLAWPTRKTTSKQIFHIVIWAARLEGLLQKSRERRCNLEGISVGSISNKRYFEFVMGHVLISISPRKHDGNFQFLDKTASGMHSYSLVTGHFLSALTNPTQESYNIHTTFLSHYAECDTISFFSQIKNSSISTLISQGGRKKSC